MCNSCSGAPSAVWLLNSPKTNNMWYDKLRQISNADDILKDLDVATSGADDGSCLALRRVSDSPPKYSLTELDCNEQRHAICRIKPPTIAAPKKLFPCLEKNNDNGRQESNGNNKQKRDGKAMYLNF